MQFWNQRHKLTVALPHSALYLASSAAMETDLVHGVHRQGKETELGQ